VWKEARPKVKGWFTRKLLTFSLAAGVAPLLPWWIPAGQPPSQFFDMIGRHPGVPVMLAWSVVLFVTVLLCIDPESARLSAGPRENAEPCQYGDAVAWC